jgi:hypothetical protein
VPNTTGVSLRLLHVAFLFHTQRSAGSRAKKETTGATLLPVRLLGMVID